MWCGALTPVVASSSSFAVGACLHLQMQMDDTNNDRMECNAWHRFLQNGRKRRQEYKSARVQECKAAKSAPHCLTVPWTRCLEQESSGRKIPRGPGNLWVAWFPFPANGWENTRLCGMREVATTLRACKKKTKGGARGKGGREGNKQRIYYNVP